MVQNKFAKLSVKLEVKQDMERLRGELGLRSLSELVTLLVKEKKTKVFGRG